VSLASVVVVVPSGAARLEDSLASLEPYAGRHDVETLSAQIRRH
jgi:hypothetical protein